MVNGFALGGAARGIASAQDLGLGQQRVGLAERQMQNNEERQLMTDADKAIGGTLKVISDTVNQAKAAGASPEKIQRLVAPLVQDINEIAQGTGRDPSRFQNAVQATINTPVQQEPTADEKIAENVRQEVVKKQLRQEAGLEEPPQEAAGIGDVEPVPFADLSNPEKKAFLKSTDKLQTMQTMLTELQIFANTADAAQTGAVTAATLPIVQSFAEIGIKLRDDIPLLEAMQAQQNQLALRLRNPDSGFGLTGNTSDRDVKFLKDAVGGLQNTPEGNKAAIMIQHAKIRRDADLQALKIQLMGAQRLGEFNDMKKQFTDQTPLFTPEEEAFLTSLRGGTGRAPAEMDDNELRSMLGIR